MSRPKEHCKPSQLKMKTHKARWLNRLVASKKMPQIIFREYSVEDDLAEREMFWIALARAWGCPLTNLTVGGEGTTGYRHTSDARQKMVEKQQGHSPTPGFSGHVHTAESRAKTSATLRAKSKLHKRTRSPETIEKQRRAMLGRRASDETKAKMSASHKRRKHEPISAATRAKITAALTGRVNGPLTQEHRNKISAALLGRKHSAETRAKLSIIGKKRPAPVLSAETRAIIAAKLKGRKPAPQTIIASIAANTGRRASQETRTKLSLAGKGRKHTTETKAKISATRRAKYGKNP